MAFGLIIMAITEGGLPAQRKDVACSCRGRRGCLRIRRAALDIDPAPAAIDDDLQEGGVGLVLADERIGVAGLHRRAASARTVPDQLGRRARLLGRERARHRDLAVGERVAGQPAISMAKKSGALIASSP